MKWIKVNSSLKIFETLFTHKRSAQVLDRIRVGCNLKPFKTTVFVVISYQLKLDKFMLAIILVLNQNETLKTVGQSNKIIPNYLIIFPLP